MSGFWHDEFGKDNVLLCGYFRRDRVALRVWTGWSSWSEKANGRDPLETQSANGFHPRPHLRVLVDFVVDESCFIGKYMDVIYFGLSTVNTFDVWINKASATLGGGMMSYDSKSLRLSVTNNTLPENLWHALLWRRHENSDP